MRRTEIRHFFSGFLAIISSLVAQPDPLTQGFLNPPEACRPQAWWHWINGNVSKEGIKADLEDMKRVGLAGAQIVDAEIYLPAGKVGYHSEAWYENLRFAVQTAKSLGLRLGIHNCAGWSESGGPWIPLEKSMKKLVWKETNIQGAMHFEGILAQPEMRGGFYRDIEVMAFPSGTNKTVPVPLHQVKRLGARLQTNGYFSWDVPEGSWVLLRFGYTSTLASNHPAPLGGAGLEVDKMDAQAVQFHFERSLEPLFRALGPDTGSTLSSFFSDSWECGRQDWTGDFPKLFQKQAGYDLFPFLPILANYTVESASQTKAFGVDFRRTISESIVSNYYHHLKCLAGAHGMTYLAQTYACQDFDQYRAGEEIDSYASEFWMHQVSNGNSDGMWPPHKAASVAHVLGRRAVAAESFTARPADGRWLPVPATLKAVGDLAFVRGINQMFLHSYVHQPRSDLWPGFTLGRYGTHFGRQNPWWEAAGSWVDYLSRCQFLLQEGQSVSDLLLLLPADTKQLYAEKNIELPPGYSYDRVTPHTFLKAVVSNKQIVLPSGTRYHLLMLPQHWTANAALLKQIKSVADSGIPIAGPPPESMDGRREIDSQSEAWNDLITALWRGASPAIDRAATPGQLVKRLAKPADFTCDPPEFHKWVNFIHRQTPWADIYFVANMSQNPVSFKGSFRTRGRLPELWNPVTTRRTPAASFSLEGDKTRVPLHLDAAESVFVIFRQSVPDRWVTAMELENTTPSGTYVARWSDGGQDRLTVDPPTRVPVPGPWSVTFWPMGQTPFTRSFSKLQSFVENDESQIRFFSGKAVYTTSFFYSNQNSNLVAHLNVGSFADVAEIRLNSEKVGCVWTAPPEIEVTPRLRLGTNQLEVTIFNRPVNRLIGDEKYPPDAEYEGAANHFTGGRLLRFPAWYELGPTNHSRLRHSFATWKHFDSNSALVPSGLIGPVQIVLSQKAVIAKVR